MRLLLVAVFCAMRVTLSAADSTTTAAVLRDDQQRVIQVTVPDGHIWKYKRDQLGRITTVMTGIGEHWVMVFHPNGTISSIMSPKGPVDLAGATAQWDDLRLVLKRPGIPDQIVISEPR